ncbi:hypothetical protein FACS189421_04250 [Bacteroidia bacterium]|nr:hypothetical protein FACS189421_04250 [Bacteroidia bacterium]GHT48073.1 hypothetical protein FACS189440_10710 [Bacteroidia bacterium]
MNVEKFQSELSTIYTQYNETIKPLIADIEAHCQQFPDSLFNEIRALNDHIARCFTSNMIDSQIAEELKKAESHVLRITFDCYKYLDVWFYDYIKKFDKDYTDKIDITLIDNGEFAPKFRKLEVDAIKMIREAKKLESKDKQKSFDLYQAAYNNYSDLEELIDSNMSKLNWAKYRKKVKWTVTVLVWIASVVISSIVTISIGCDEIVAFFTNTFER